jgi:hypothetical protein
VVHEGAGEHEAVEQRDRHANVHALGQHAEHAIRDCSVHVQELAHARVRRRHHERLVCVDEAHVADQRLVEHGVNQRAVVAAAIGAAAQARALGGGEALCRRLL